MTAVGDAGGGVQLDLRRKFARRHSRHRCNGLPRASRVIGIHGTAQQRLFRIGKQCVVLLLSGEKFREKVGVKIRVARKGQDRSVARVHRHDCAARFISQRLLSRLLKIKIESEREVFSCHRWSIT